jgi:hypothetical protein
MKKFIIIASIAALSVSVYAMSKTPADSSACGADKACVVKDATAAGAEAKADVTKAAEEKAGCAGGVCPLKK